MRSNQTLYDFNSKKVLVLGLGLHGGGVGTVKFLAREGARITVTDLRSKKVLKPSLDAIKDIRGIRYTLGEHQEKDLGRIDLVVKNPGIPPSSPYLHLIKKKKIPVTSDIGIFFARCRGKIIGVTGTRGKSTTAYLIAKFLEHRKGSKDGRVFLGGNIRKSVLSFLSQVKKGDVAVLELSSFQLQDLKCEKKSPQIAVFTNLLRDHLNWHRNIREYTDAKSVIFKFQQKRDILFANPDDQIVRKIVQNAPARVIFPGLAKELKPIVDKNLGIHYESSAALAAGVAGHFKIPFASIKKVLENFRGLEGRQQHIATIGGVHFINDTTSTIPDATIQAILRFREKAGNNKLILIAGGQDKNLDFRNLVKILEKKVDELILLRGTATEKILSMLSKKYRNEHSCTANSMREAVHFTSRSAEAGDYAVLSPGATSFGMFQNEFDRGDHFIKEINRLRIYVQKR